MAGANVSQRALVQQIYTAEIGVREQTGNNDGARVEEYLKVTGLGKGYAWCAAFVAWTYKQAGVKAPRSAYSPDWFLKNVILLSNPQRVKNGHLTPHPSTNGEVNKPQTSDVFGIYFASKKRIAHVGFIDKWDNESSFCITVEGNTNDAGSREGDGVYRKRRLKSQIYKVSRWIN